jgi:hypothetical protein
LEIKMLVFVKDLLAMLALCGFSAASLAWMDAVARLL